MTQKEALDILKTGRNVFLTGAAGSGKTYVLRQYIEYLRGLGANAGLTASTGIAATHMGGITIHSWSGIGVRDSLSPGDIAEIAEKRHVKQTVQNAAVLIIDEISMLHHYRLDMIDRVVREIKNSNEPFGGMQVVFCGDFFQLPPVRRADAPETFFAYHSEAWKNLNLKICYLAEQHRQSDMQYLKVLNDIRNDAVSAETLDILNSRLVTAGGPGAVQPLAESATRLYSHNKDVDEENEKELAKIGGKVSEYEMQSRGKRNLIETLKKSCLAPEVLRLKIGAKVMFVRNNYDKGYVNGTLGVVTRCSFEEIKVRTLAGEEIEVERETWVIEEDGKIKAEINQFPLRLAWAITVHKSQGMSLDAAEVDLRDSFERGMGYVALSRVRSLDGLFLKGFNDLALRVNPEVLERDKKFREFSKTCSFQIRTMGDEKRDKMHEEFAVKIRPASPNSAGKKPKLDTVSTTREMLDEGKSLKEIAKERKLKLGTILDHVEQIRADDPAYNIYNLQSLIPKSKFRQIYGAFRKVGMSDGQYKLAPVRELLGPKFSYDDLRLVRLFL